MSELLCLPCQVSGVRAGEDRWRLAVYLIDGMSVCGDHAKPMIKVLAGPQVTCPGCGRPGSIGPCRDCAGQM